MSIFLNENNEEKIIEEKNMHRKIKTQFTDLH